jgi:hypothetical protein
MSEFPEEGDSTAKPIPKKNLTKKATKAPIKV